MAISLNGALIAEGYSVSGIISSPKSGTIFIALLNEKEFSGQENYRFGLRLKASASGEQKTFFTFKDVPAGVYAIRCFLDTNDNGKLDMGLFGPKEPYGFYKPMQVKTRAPVFAEVSFVVAANTDDIHVVLR